MYTVSMAPSGKHLDVKGLGRSERDELMALCGGRGMRGGLRVRTDPSLIALIAEHLPGAKWARGARTWAKRELRGKLLSPPARIEGIESHRRWEDLRGYQKIGVRYLLERWRVLLGDQMGLGKTIQTAVAAEMSGKARRCLVVCPNYSKAQWAEEIDLWRKDDAVKVYIIPSVKDIEAAGGSRGKSSGAAREAIWQGFIRDCKIEPDIRHYLIMHWDVVRLFSERLGSEFWDWLVIDEAHHMKNRKALRTKALHGIWSKRVVLLTGTPIMNYPDELWSLLHMLWPDKYRSYWRFYNAFVKFWHSPKGYDRVSGVKNQKVLQLLVAAFTIRRLRNEVLQELPPVTQMIYRPLMSQKQRRLYNDIKSDILIDIQKHGGEGGVLVVNALARTVKLLQAASSTAHFKGLEDESGKLDAVCEFVRDRVAEDEKVVIFCRFVETVRRLCDRLDRGPNGKKKGTLGEGVLRFDGEVGDSGFKAFQGGEGSVLVCTYGVAKEAVNLQRAGIVVMAAVPWTPAEFDQAVARADRIGQQREGGVVCAVFLSKGTLDEQIMILLKRKRRVSKAVLILSEALSAELKEIDAENR